MWKGTGNWIVLYWGGQCYPMHCDIFLDLLCSPNLDTRTWIWRLNFAQRPIFSSMRFFNEPAWSPSRRTCAPDFYVLKNPLILAGFEPANLGSRGDPESTEADKELGILSHYCFLWKDLNFTTRKNRTSEHHSSGTLKQDALPQVRTNYLLSFRNCTNNILQIKAMFV